MSLLLAQALVYSAIGGALVGGMAIVVLAARKVLGARSARFEGAQLVLGLVALICGLPLAAAALVVGGTMGGAYGAALSERLGYETSPIIPLGIGIGRIIFTVPELLVVGVASLVLFRRTGPPILQG